MKPMDDKMSDVIASCHSITNLQCVFQIMFRH